MMFQSPSLRGSGRFRLALVPCLGGPDMFQSPSLRGSGRFILGAIAFMIFIFSFQSPSLRGSGRFARARAQERAKREVVSIPFIAGQWSLRQESLLSEEEWIMFQSPSLRGSGRFFLNARSPKGGWASFNPLHCGAVVASERATQQAPVGEEFQSPSLRGSGRF